MKECRRCLTVKPLADFHTHKGMADGHLNHCKTCTRYAAAQRYSKDKSRAAAQQNTYYHKNREARLQYGAKYHMLRTHGMTPDDYQAMLDAQGGKCKICGTSDGGTVANGKPGRFRIDHCHATGRVRGLLCHSCNAGLGHFKDRIETLEAAIAYLSNKGT